MHPAFCLFLCVTLSPGSLHALAPQTLLVDANPAARAHSSFPAASRAEPGNTFRGGFVKCGKNWFFTATDSAQGTELWRTDSTTNGTNWVKDIRPGPKGSSPASLICCNDTLFFTADDGQNGRELWKSDGTSMGTVAVGNIGNGPSGSRPEYLECMGGKVYFAATSATSGRELWCSDGSKPTLVSDIRGGSKGSYPRHQKEFAGKLFFQAFNTTTGTELWISDGTARGTKILKNIYAGNGSSTPDQFCELDANTLLFRATHPSTGTELWKTNGTPGGTLLVKNIAADKSNAGISSRLSLNYPDAKLGKNQFFTADDGQTGIELWTTDGTGPGTRLVHNINPGADSSNPHALALFQGKILFRTNNGLSSPKHDQLWQTDGSTGGTKPIRFLPLGATGAAPTPGAELNGKYYFGAASQLWVYANGTAQVLINHAPLSEAPADFTAIASQLMYRAATVAIGTELMVTDGTTNGSSAFRDLYPGQSTRPSSPSPITSSLDGKTVFFAATNQSDGTELWRHNSSGAVRIKDIRPGAAGSFPREITCCWIGTKVVNFFAASDGSKGTELWTTDGTANGTRQLKDIRPGAESSFPRYLTHCNGLLFFSATNGSMGTELWRSDGTALGTQLVKDIQTASASSYPGGLTCCRGILYFTAKGSNGTELWRSDGTANGTFEVADIRRGSRSSNPTQLTCCGDALYFSADDGSNGTELWISDGTGNGTTILSIRSGSLGAFPFNLTKFKNKLYFAANNGSSGTELWMHDPAKPLSAAVIVRDIAKGSASSQPAGLTSNRDTLFFAATQPGTTGRELWKSDGTTAGTTRVTDIVPGAPSSCPANLLSVGKGVYFTATNARAGNELWFSDGTRNRTGPVDDVRTGSTSSFPVHLALCDGRLYFAADDGRTGLELHARNRPGASVTKLGQGSANAFATLEADNPVLGQRLTLHYAHGPGIGLALITLPIGPFAPTCAQPNCFRKGASAYFNPGSIVFQPLANQGSGTLRIDPAVPNIPAFNGLQVHAQIMWASGAQTFPIELTNGLQLNLGY